MTVLENLLVAQHNKLMRASGMSVFGLLGLKRYRTAEAAAIDKARIWLERKDASRRSHQASEEKRKVTDVGPRIDDRHSRAQLPFVQDLLTGIPSPGSAQSGSDAAIPGLDLQQVTVRFGDISEESGQNGLDHLFAFPQTNHRSRTHCPTGGPISPHRPLEFTSVRHSDRAARHCNVVAASPLVGRGF